MDHKLILHKFMHRFKMIINSAYKLKLGIYFVIEETKELKDNKIISGKYISLGYCMQLRAWPE